MSECRSQKLNEKAYGIVQEMINRADALRISSYVSDCGATVVDVGIDVPGSPEAGRLFATASLGGAASVELGTSGFGKLWLPSVTVITGEPVRGCMASQYAGWVVRDPIGGGPFFAMGSGPARALFGGEELFRGEFGRYVERSDRAVLTMETRCFPPDSVLVYLAQSCGIDPENLSVLLAPTASIAGSVQIASRIVETGLHKLHNLDFDIDHVICAWGQAPVSPLASSDGLGMGWTNDGILYGGSVWLTVDCADEEVKRILEKLPACSSRDYGTPFFELLQRYEWDFYRIDPLLFSPAVVYVNNMGSGKTYRAGKVDAELLEREWLSVCG